MALDLARASARVSEQHAARAWPAEKWQRDPVGFARCVMGYEPWERQREMLEIVAENPRAAFASGHRVGKTDTIGILAWWFYSSFRDARVILVGPTNEHIDATGYRAVRRLLLGSGRCVECKKADPDGPRPCPHSALVTGDPASSSHHGIRSTNDLREIRGINVRSEEAAQGIAGENILILADEASGEYFDKITGALAGNRAGGARMALFGNPIRPSGEFAEAFSTKAEFYTTRRISSEDSPNVKAGRTVVPGLATRDWVEEQLAEYGGRDSPFFKMRVLGQHVSVAEGAIFQPGLIAAAVDVWKSLRDPSTGAHYRKPRGELVIAVDPAGDSGTGDESGFMVRVGLDVLTTHVRLGLSPDAHVVEVLGLIVRYRENTDGMVRVVLDSAGDVGARVRGAFMAYVAAHPEDLERFSVTYLQTGHRAQRDAERYHTIRDEMCACLVDWLRDGGGIPDDAKLLVELSRYAWHTHVTGRSRATPKEGRGGLREELGRSPTRSDLLLLSTYIRNTWAPLEEPPAEPAFDDKRHDPRVAGIDVYAWERSFREGGG
jgi:hypothetical protein